MPNRPRRMPARFHRMVAACAAPSRTNRQTGSLPGLPRARLGLALCRRLARQMGGDLRLDTSIKEGACFVLTLAVV